MKLPLISAFVIFLLFCEVTCTFVHIFDYLYDSSEENEKKPAQTNDISQILEGLRAQNQRLAQMKAQTRAPAPIPKTIAPTIRPPTTTKAPTTTTTTTKAPTTTTTTTKAPTTTTTTTKAPTTAKVITTIGPTEDDAEIELLQAEEK